jgi:hypothetical protein
MTFIYLPNQHPQTLKSLSNGLFYPKDWSYTVDVPYRCAPVWCAYSGDFTDESHSWTNLTSGQVYKTHPLGLTTCDSSFYGGFYEITAIKDLTFEEGESWCPDTSAKIRVEKTDARSIWNPFFQRYDQSCHCIPNNNKVEKRISNWGSVMYFDDTFRQCRELFFSIYCDCGMQNNEHQLD